jgi:flagella basal body P-ring formation protein FlgA
MIKRVVVTFALLLIATAAAAAEVRLRSSAACTAPIVRLADVAEVFSEDARIAAALADIPLCPAPAAGSQRSLSQHDVRQLLALSGVESSAALVTGSETVSVIAEAASSTSRARRPLVATGVRQALFETDTEISRKLPSRSAAQLPIAPSADTKEATPLRLVERGATVTIHARTPGVQITTSGKALEAGTAGQTVSVELADNKQRVLAVVTGPQVVEVSAGASGTAATASPPKAAANGTATNP